MSKDKISKKFVNTFLVGRKPYYWLFGIAFLVYARSLFFNFTYLDDQTLILDNLFFLKNWGNLFKIFTQEVFHILHSSAAYYRPMLTLTFMWDATFSGQSPFFYHLTNILIHSANALFLFIFLKKLGYGKKPSFVFSMIFAVHPVLSQAVSWIPGRNDSLLVFFALPSLIFFVRYLEKGKSKDFIYHLLFFAATIFTKESGILLPIFAVGIVYLYKKEKIFSPKMLGTYGAWFVTYIIWFFLRSVALLNNPLKYEFGDILKTLYINSPAVVLYLGKIFIPVNLSVLPTLQDSTLIYGFLAVLVLAVMIFTTKKKNWLILAFGAAWFIAFLLPSFIRPDSRYVADFIEHRVYMPFIGLGIVLLETDIFKKLSSFKKPWIYLTTVLILVLSIATLLHISVFAGRLIFWKNAVANSPSHPLAQRNLGAMYYLDDNLDEAEKYFKKSLELNKYEQMANNNLGLIYMRRGKLEKAEEYFKKELEVNPSYDNAYYNWGLLKYQKGEKEEAANLWLKTLEINPDHKGAYESLFVYYRTLGELDKANYFYQEALKRGAKIAP